MHNRHLLAGALCLFALACKDNKKEPTAETASLPAETAARESQQATEVTNSKTVELRFHPKLKEMQLGQGVDIEDKMVFKPAAIRFTKLHRNRHVPHINIKTYLSREREDDAGDFTYDTNLDAVIPVFGDGDFRTTTHINTQNITEKLKLVFVLSSEYDPEVPNASQPVGLTDSARGMQGDPAAFSNRYGDYYCSSLTMGHRAKVEVLLSSSFSGYVKNFFQEGGAAVDFDLLSVDARSTIRSEVRRTTRESQANVQIDAYGGVEARDYAAMIRDLIASDSSYEAIKIFLGKFIENFDYSNAKPVSCVLSDYSTWGIPGIDMMRPDKIATQKKLKSLHASLSREMANCRLLLGNTVFRNNYSPAQLETVRTAFSQYATLRDTLYQVHTRLNRGEFSLINKDLELETTFLKIKQTTPEAFDFLAARKKGTHHQFVRQPGPPGSGIYLAKIALLNTILYNTMNSLAAFNFISSIALVNNYTGKEVAIERLPAITRNNLLDNGQVKSVPFELLFDDQKLNSIASSLDNDMINTQQSYMRQSPLLTAKLNYSYNLVLTDKAQRVFNFPWLNILIASFNPYPGFLSYADHALPESCCAFLDDYEEPEFAMGDTENGTYDINTLYMSFRRFDLPVSDSLVFDLETDNTLVNSILADSGYNHGVMAKTELVDPDMPPLYPILHNQSSMPFNMLTIRFYSKNKNNERDSEIQTLKIPNSRKICMPVVEVRKQP